MVCAGLQKRTDKQGLCEVKQMEGIHCDNCPNGKNKTEKEMKTTSCNGIYNKIDCFIEFLQDKKLIYISNGSERMAVDETIYNILRHCSTDKKERECGDVNTPKPCEIASALICGRIKG